MRTILWSLIALIALAAVRADAEPAPSRDARAVMEEFWRNTDASRFGANGALLADDIVFIDPIWGRYEGKEAVARFLAQFDGAGAGCCTLDRLVTDGNVGWALWTLHAPGDEQPWVGVYRVKNGKIVFYQDIRQRVYSPAEQKAHIEAFRKHAQGSTTSP